MAELIVGLASIFTLVFLMRDALVRQRTTLAHDVLYWIYPWYQYAADNVLRGHLPWWNPFTHSGEPFYPMLAQLRWFDPVTFVVLFAGSTLTPDLLTIFAWDRICRGLIFAAGTYCLLRPWAEHTVTRCSLWPVLLLSSFQLSSLRQDAVPSHFLWAPWIMLLTFRLVCSRDYRWQNWILLAGLIGLNWQSYFFAGTWIFVLLFACGAWLFARECLISLVQTKGKTLKLATALIIIAVMCFPNVVLLVEQSRFFLLARLVDPGLSSGRPIGGPQQWEPSARAITVGSVVMPYSHVALTGTSSKFADFLQLATPFGSRFVTKPGWGETSEAFMYFGLLVYVGAVWGLLAGTHPLKRVWLVIGIGFGLLMLGPAGGLHSLLFYLYPPLWFVRHTHALVLFFSVAVLYFYVLGCNRFIQEFPACLARFIEWQEGLASRVAEVKASLRSESASWALILTGALLIGVGFLVDHQDLRSMLWERGAPPFSSLSYGMVFGIQTCLIVAGMGAILVFLTKWASKDAYRRRLIRAALAVGLVVLASVMSPDFFTRLFGKSGVAPLWSPTQFIMLLVGQTCAVAGTAAFLLSVVRGLEPDDPIYTGLVIPAVLIGAAFWGKQLGYEFPQTVILAVLMAGAGVAVWWLRRRLGHVSLFLILVLSHLTAVFLMEHDRWRYFAFLAAVIITWALALEWCRRNPGAPAHHIVPAVLLLVLTGDLLFYAGHARGLWDWPRLDTTMGVEAVIQEPRWPASRVLFAGQEREAQPYDQAVRYEETLSRTPSVLTVPKQRAGVTGPSASRLTPSELTTELLAAKRWNSYLMLPAYFHLIHSRIPVAALHEILAVKKPLIQFKRQSIPVSDDGAIRLLRDLGERGSVRLLEQAVLVDSPSPDDPADHSKQRMAHPCGLGPGASVGCRPGPSDSPASDWRVNHYDYHSLDLTVELRENAYLYWSDGYDRYWRAFVDGQEVPVIRANLAGKAVQLASGTHRVQFAYLPELYALSVRIFLVMQVVVVVACLVLWLWPQGRDGGIYQPCRGGGES